VPSTGLSGSQRQSIKSTRAGGAAAEAARRRAALTAQQSERRAGRIADMRRVAIEALLGDQLNDLDREVDVEEDEDEDADGACEVADAEMAGSQVCGQKRRRLRRLHRTLFFARQLQVPDWMLEAPEDLATSWLLLVRPEGDRCLLLSDGGQVEVRRKNGYVLERYVDSRMPRGLTILDTVCIEGPLPAPTAAAGPVDDAPPIEIREDGGEATESVEADAQDVYLASVEDEVQEEADCDMGSGRSTSRHCAARGGRAGRRGGRGGGRGGIVSSGASGNRGRRGRPLGHREYAVCDVLMWGDTDLMSADAECRAFWLASRFSELPTSTPRRARRLKLIPAMPATPDAFATAYRDERGYSKDSLLFVHCESHYAVGEAVTPLALLWRDRHISRFVVDTPDGSGQKLPERQAIVLELRGGLYLRTADRILVGQLTQEAVDAVLPKCAGKHKVLLRCEVDDVDLTARKLLGAKAVAHVSSRSRVWPDSWGRIVFQYLHRKGDLATISFEAVQRVAAGRTAE